MPPVRSSALQLAEHCQLAEYLNREYPHHEQETLVGQAVDEQACAELSGGVKADHPDARACAWWVRETLVHVQTQLELAVHDPDTGELLSPGRADVVGINRRSRVLTIVDFKKREQYWNALPPPDESLQLHAYGMAAATLRRAPQYQTCLLLFGDGAVQDVWSRIYDVGEQRPILDRIRKICANKDVNGGIRPKGHSGPWCTGCYQRRNCSHWLLPIEHVETALAPLATPGGLTHENFESVYLAWKQGESLCNRVETMLKDFTDRAGAGRVGEDKEWGPELQRGARRGASADELEKAGHGSLVRQGEPKMVYRLRRRR